jgi:hypothetical protein
MVTECSDVYMTNCEWFRAVVGGGAQVLRGKSALECHQLFVGYLNEMSIDVYATEKGGYENINYRVVPSFDGIDIESCRGVRCTTIDFTVNEMLEEPYGIYDQALIEGLARYYFTHGESFDGLHIKPENMASFNIIKEWAVDYYRY